MGSSHLLFWQGWLGTLLGIAGGGSSFSLFSADFQDLSVCVHGVSEYCLPHGSLMLLAFAMASACTASSSSGCAMVQAASTEGFISGLLGVGAGNIIGCCFPSLTKSEESHVK